MGIFSEIRFARKVQQRQLMGYSNSHNFSGALFPKRHKKTEIEKYINRQKIAYPNSWRYFVNRLSWGLERLSRENKQGKVELTESQGRLLHSLVQRYWSRKYHRLVIAGKRNMDFFKELEKLVPNSKLLKALYGRKNQWATSYTKVTLKSPVSGSHWINGRFSETYEVPLLLTYNFHHLTSTEKPKLIEPQDEVGKDNFQLEKILVKPVGISDKDKWKYGNTYWAWLPALQKRKTFIEETCAGYCGQRDNFAFWSDKKNQLLS